jgi:hypothetical protein
MPTAPPPFHLDSALASLDKLISLSPSVLYYSHFGKASNAVQRIRDYKLQLQLWARIAEQGVRDNKSLEEIRDEILAEDPIMRRLHGYLRSHKVYSRTALRNTVQGFIGYAKQNQSKAAL